MKRYAVAAVAALMAAGPLSATAAEAQTFGRQSGERQDYRRDNDRRDNDRRDNRDYDRRDNDRRDFDRRDNGRTDRWDRGSHNGYFVNGRWYYGPPPAWAMARRDFRPGYNQWRRGDRLPGYYRSHYRQVDWRRERLRQPPRGYHYVRDDRGEVLLVAIATGVILSVLLSN
jgi:Ni/Co efflux regulator RcnB